MKISLNKGEENVKMIHFIQKLYSSFKILNKLSEKESNQFQREVISQLVDSQQNVDIQNYNSITNRCGLQGFILEILSNVINRNPFKNQFQLNKNLSVLTQTIKKQQQDLQKKQKILDRKQQKIKNTEDSLIANVKQKIVALENQAIQKIVKREGEIKKSISNCLNQLKTKEKLILEKYDQTKNNMKLISQLEQKERAVNEKIKQLQKKQKQIKTKDNQSILKKKDTQLQQLKDIIEKLQQNIKEINNKYKNLQLAYRKVKVQGEKSNIKRSENQIQKQIIIEPISLKQHTKNKTLEMEALQFSRIELQEKKNTCQQLLNHIHFEELNEKIELLRKIFSKSGQKMGLAELSSIQQLLSINIDTNIETNKETQLIAEIQSDIQKQNENDYPSFISQDDSISLDCLKKNITTNELDDIISQVKNISLEKSQEKYDFIQRKGLESLIQKCRQLNTPFSLCEAILGLILQLIEESKFYDEIISYLSKKQICQFLQHIYLSHETNQDLTETSTLVLSRIKLKSHQLSLTNPFIRALQIRMKVEDKGSFLFGNINYILS